MKREHFDDTHTRHGTMLYLHAFDAEILDETEWYIIQHSVIN